MAAHGFWVEAWRRYRRRPLALAALGFVGFLVAVAVLAPAIAGTKPVLCRYKGRLYAPCLAYFDRRLEPAIEVGQAWRVEAALVAAEHRLRARDRGRQHGHRHEKADEAQRRQRQRPPPVAPPRLDPEPVCGHHSTLTRGSTAE